MKATQYLLDNAVTKWSGLKDSNGYAKWVIGGPTLELLVASYNKVNSSSPVTIAGLGANGYSLTLGNYTLPNTNAEGVAYNPWNHGTRYWLVCPGNYNNQRVLNVKPDSSQVEHSTYLDKYAFRPVVCLESNVILTWNETTSKYDLTSND